MARGAWEGQEDNLHDLLPQDAHVDAEGGRLEQQHLARRSRRDHDELSRHSEIRRGSEAGARRRRYRQEDHEEHVRIDVAQGEHVPH